MKDAVEFTEPPEKYRKRVAYDWDTIYANLKANPGQWAWLNPGHVATVGTYVAVTQGKIKNFQPSMGIEMRTSDNDYNAKPRTCNLWARYNPDLDESLTVKERQQAWREIRKAEKEKKMQDSTVETEG